MDITTFGGDGVYTPTPTPIDQFTDDPLSQNPSLMTIELLNEAEQYRLIDEIATWKILVKPIGQRWALW